MPRVQLDNDAYNFWMRPGERSDDEYTNGVVLSLESLHAPWWGHHFAPHTPPCDGDAAGAGACLATTVALGQDMYTPRLDRAPHTAPQWELERPYAAWLYLRGSARVVAARHLRAVDLAVGVTGAPALGELAQHIAHAINARYTTRATGWETQVGFQPGVQLAWRESLLAVRAAPGGRGLLDIMPDASVSLGNILTAADAGVRARLGLNLSHPWDPRRWRARSLWEVYLTGGAHAEYVAYNFSLDGTLLHPDRQVHRVPGVTEYEVGAGVRLHRLSLGYRAVTRSREYSSGPRTHVYGSMIGALEFHP
jgi:hypothetical protein